MLLAEKKYEKWVDFEQKKQTEPRNGSAARHMFVSKGQPCETSISGHLLWLIRLYGQGSPTLRQGKIVEVHD